CTPVLMVWLYNNSPNLVSISRLLTNLSSVYSLLNLLQKNNFLRVDLDVRPTKSTRKNNSAIWLVVQPTRLHETVLEHMQKGNNIMATISLNTSLVTTINTFTVAPENQQRALELLIEIARQLSREAQGFVSSNFHKSVD